MTKGYLSTHLIWHNSRGNERNTDVTVTYQFLRGSAQTYGQPAEPDSIEILDIEGAIEVPESFYEDDALIAECMADYRDRVEYAAEEAADARREMREAA